MAISQQLNQAITYNDPIKQIIVSSGGTIIFTKDNMIIASDLSESQYRELLRSEYVEKIDVLPLKSYGNVPSTILIAPNIALESTNTSSA